MRKNKTIRFAAILLVLTLLSTCVVSGTFAKYTTDGNTTDTARVAKWGITVTATGNEAAFAKEYNEKNAAAATVKSDVKVVAPGTSGDLASFKIAGTSEVTAEIKYEATIELTGWTVEGAYYCPLVVTVGQTALNGTTYDSADKFAAAIKAAIEGANKTVDAGTALDSNSDVAVTWAWAFKGDDAKDTALGNAAGNAAEAAKITVTIKATVTQVD